MFTIFLKFTDRAEALSILASHVGYQTTAAEPGGRELHPVGFFGGVRYDLCFLSDAGVSMSAAGDHVNLLWWGEPEHAPMFAGHVVTPLTPNCAFAT